MPGKRESSTEGTLASDDGGPLTAQASTSTPPLVLGSRPMRSMLVRWLPTRESVDPEVASIEARDSPQPMLLDRPEQRSVSQIDRQIDLLPHPVLSWLRSAQPLLAVLPAQLLTQQR
jgi:hypothetical protein